MLKELADKIQDLVEGQIEPEIVDHLGVDYIKTAKGYSVLNKPQADAIRVNSLTGLIEMIKTSLLETKDVDEIYKPLIVNVGVNDVKVLSGMDTSKDRQELIRAYPIVPDLSMGYDLTVEELIILLSTSFVPTGNTSKFIESISSLRVVEEVSFNDDGIGQTVVAKQGASINKSFQVQPIVKLKPIRSYAEIEQVESKFLFRVNKNGTVCLREADGGQWKYEVQTRIVKYLKENLKDLIENNEVKIIG